MTGCYCCLLGFDCVVPRCIACQGQTSLLGGCCEERYRCGAPQRCECFRQDQCCCSDSRCGFGEKVPCMIACLGLTCMNCKKKAPAEAVPAPSAEAVPATAPDATASPPQAQEMSERASSGDEQKIVPVEALCCKSACLCCVQGYYCKLPECCAISVSLVSLPYRLSPRTRRQSHFSPPHPTPPHPTPPPGRGRLLR